MAKDKKCYFCKKKVDEGDWCYGCNHYVCQNCYYDKNGGTPDGQHNVKAHGRRNLHGKVKK